MSYSYYSSSFETALVREALWTRVVLVFPTAVSTPTLLLAERWLRFGSGDSVLSDDVAAREIVVRGRLHAYEARTLVGAPDAAEAVQLWEEIGSGVEAFCRASIQHLPDEEALPFVQYLAAPNAAPGHGRNSTLETLNELMRGCPVLQPGR
ncbi:hypothetical protein EXIGLDRAFT_769603 [Exidia glandulosa HHB12029]|uniref:Uncharacterized protein n=1 Tax=Exidia glandulosa HHB12029 TaxID=1314781 RepID=A0A165HC18_EXIGL|nr:hypothetical protein EXIGLDRAFT_769603 [Exidia glandulosa HHB12029]